MKRQRNALTLVELLIAMVITAMIGMSVVGVSVVLSNAHAASEADYDNTQIARMTLNRLTHLLQRAKLVTSVGSDHIIYWAEDANDDGQIQFTELGVVKYDKASGTLTANRVQMSGQSNPMDFKMPLSTVMSNSTLSTVQNSVYCDSRLLAENVRAFEVSAFPPCPEASLITLKITVSQDGRELTLRSAANLRADMLDEIAYKNGQFTLTNESAGG